MSRRCVSWCPIKTSWIVSASICARARGGRVGMASCSSLRLEMMTWAVEPGEGDGAPTRLVVTTAIVPGSRVEAEFQGGTEYIVSALKTFLETGVPLAVA
jgi:hypothetical protein